jgi:exodeoxyribonuclease-5
MSDKLIWTEEQQKAINAMQFFLNYNVGQEFVLIGSAGTGKSTIIRELVKGRNKDTILGVTVSHAAKNVLRKINGSWMKCDTIARAFGLKSSYDAKGKEIFTIDPSKKDFSLIEDVLILIVDECSMIDSKTYEMIRSNIPKKAKIIFCGDIYQLPPVSDGDDSKTFDISNRAILTIPVRYDEIIGETAHYYRYLIELFREYGDEGFDYNWLYDWMPTKNSRTGDSSIEYVSTESVFLERFIDYYKKDRYNTRILCYRNETIRRYNAQLRNIFYGTEEEMYVEGEQIIMNKPYFKTGGNIHNGEMYIIQAVTIDSVNLSYCIANNKGSFDTEKKEFYFYLLSLKMTNSDKVGFVKVLHPYSQQDFDNIEYQLLNQAKSNKLLWGEFYRFRNEWADVSYTYAISTHKSQGQTLTNVLVNANDILDVKRIDTRVKLQSLYVAVTRPQNNLTVLLNKEMINQ